MKTPKTTNTSISLYENELKRIKEHVQSKRRLSVSSFLVNCALEKLDQIEAKVEQAKTKKKKGPGPA